MSFETQRWAELQKVGDAHRKAVLACLAQFADESHSCYPGQAKIAEITELGVRTVRRHLKQLEVDGFIIRFHRHVEGRHGRSSDRYVLAVDASTQAANLTARDSDSSGQPEPTQAANQNTQAASGDTSFLNEPPEEQPVEPPEVLVDFEVFWSRYPARNGKKLEKPKALVQWRRLSKAQRDLALTGVSNYRAACDRQLFIARDAHRWLRDRSFLDWQTPAKVPTVTSNSHQPYRNPDPERYRDTRI